MASSCFMTRATIQWLILRASDIDSQTSIWYDPFIIDKLMKIEPTLKVEKV